MSDHDPHPGLDHLLDWAADAFDDHLDPGVDLDAGEPAPGQLHDLGPDADDPFPDHPDDVAHPDPIGPLHFDAPQDPGPSDPAIDLSADGDHDIVLDPAAADDIVLDPVADLDDTLTSRATLDHTLHSLLGLDAGDLHDVVDRLGLTDELDDGLDGRSTAVVLGELGADALVEHGSLDDLAARLDAGDEVVVSASDGRPATVVDLDLSTGACEVVDADGLRHLVAPGTLEDRWSGSAYQMVLAHADAPAGGPIRLAGGVTVLPVRLPLAPR